jgi:pimeloyl-ACP methyl ester carboxylesterase
MEPLFEHRTEFAGSRTRALELEGAGPPVLLLHGFADSADTWRFTLDRLARVGRRALAIDLPGFGAAAALEPGPVVPQLQRAAVGALEYLASEAGEPVIACGNSLGASVSMLLAQRDDLPHAGTVAVAPAGLEMPLWFSVIEADPLVRWILRAPTPLADPIVRRTVEQIYRTLAFARPAAAPSEVVSAFARHIGSRAAAARVLATGRHVLGELHTPFALERVRGPLLLVWGTRDRMVPPSGADRVLDAVPGAELELLAGCGHCPQLEQPDRFAELLLGFPRGRVPAAVT